VIAVILQIAIKILVTGLLGGIAVGCVAQVYWLWFDRAIALTTFDYYRDGKPAPESGPYFTRLISQYLRELAALYGGQRQGQGFSIPTTDQIGRGRKIELPIVRESSIEDVDVQAYGIKFGGVLRAVRRWINAPSEITGSVGEKGTIFTVGATLDGPAGDGDRRVLSFSETGDMQRAAFLLACRLFRTIGADSGARAASPAHRTTAAPERNWLASATDDDFCRFTDALLAYERYRGRLADVGPDAAAGALVDAEQHVSHLVKKSSTLSYADKLAAFIYHDRGDDTQAQRALGRYRQWVQRHGTPDEDAEQLEATLRNTRVATALPGPTPARVPAPPPSTAAPSRPSTPAPASTTPPATPPASVPPLSAPSPAEDGRLSVAAGSPIRVVSESQSILGRACCFVRDSKGTYALVPDFLLDGREAAQVFIDSKGAGHLLGTPSLRPGSRLGVSGGALVRLDSGIRPVQEVPGIGPIKGAVASVTDLDFASPLRAFVSRGPVDARAIGSAVSSVIHVSTSRDIVLNDAINITSVSRAGDGGSPVLAIDGRLVGMVYAGSSDVTIVVPIWRLLRDLEVTLLQ
jgi:hypothetical protein